MGQLTLTTLVEEVQSGLLNRNDLTDDRCVRALNFAQNRVSRGHDFQELKGFFQTATFFTSNPANDKFLPLAPFTKHIHTAVLNSGDSASSKLIHIPWRTFDERFPTPEFYGRSRPTYYSRWNNQAIIVPIPDRVYPVFMRVTSFPRPFDLTQFPTATSDYDQKDDILIALACAYLWKSFGRSDKANDYVNEAQHYFIAAIKQDTEEPDLEIKLDLTEGTGGEYWANPFVRRAP